MTGALPAATEPKSGQEQLHITDRRTHRRLDLQLPVECRSLAFPGASLRGFTANISTGGLALEIEEQRLNPGDVISLRIDFPAAEGVWPSDVGGMCRARVLRCRNSLNDDVFGGGGQSVAVQFLDRMRFEV